MNCYIIKGSIIVAALRAARGGQPPEKPSARDETKPAPAPKTTPQ
jgi:hypothetical protein